MCHLAKATGTFLQEEGGWQLGGGVARNRGTVPVATIF